MMMKRQKASPLSPPGYSQPSHEDETRSIILTAARALIQRYGFRKTTMDDIARAMGKQRSSLYYYFSGKEDVIKALVDNEFAEMSRAVRDEVNGQTDAAGRLRTYMIARIQQAALRCALYSQILPEFRGDDVVDMFRISEQRQIFDETEEGFVADIIIQGIRDGQFRFFSDEHVSIFTHFAFSAIRGIELELFLDPSRAKDLKPRLDVACDVLLRGLLQ